MNIKILQKISLIALICLVFETSKAEESLKSLGKFKDWESFVLLQNENKICFAQSIPIIRAPKKLVREPSRLFVSFRPNENIKKNFSFVYFYIFFL